MSSNLQKRGEKKYLSIGDMIADIKMSYYNIWKIIMSILYLTSHRTQAASLRCYQSSITDYIEVPLKQSPDLVNTSYIKLNQELDIIIHGYSTDIDEQPMVQDVINSFIQAFADSKSICALYWKEESNAYIGNLTEPIKKFLGLEILGIEYFPVSVIAGKLGVDLGKTLLKMKSRGLQMESVYLIGHSEGAHLAGAAGRVVKSRGMLIERITGLDASKYPITQPLDKTCAKLVDLIHSHPRLYGTNEAIGHIDFWPNYGCAVQPGCKLYTLPLSFIHLCSHVRSLSLLADAVKYPESLQGRRATSYSDFKRSKGTAEPKDINTIGFKINPNNTGSFYLCTKAESQYGTSSRGMDPTRCTCPYT